MTESELKAALEAGELPSDLLRRTFPGKVDEMIGRLKSMPLARAVLAADAWLTEIEEGMAKGRAELAPVAGPGDMARMDELNAWVTGEVGRVKAWLEEASRRRQAAVADVDLLAHMPSVRKFVDDAPNIFFPADAPDGQIRFFAVDAAGGLTAFLFAGLNKDQIADAVRNFSKSDRPVALIMVTEQWRGSAGTAAAKKVLAQGRIDLQDESRCKELGIERSEAFVVQVETAAGIRAWHWPILPGRKLGPREDMGVSGGGRFQGLLQPEPEKVN